MSKKTILKVIAAICVMSMCFAAVFTGAVSAETATCTVTGYKYSPGAIDVYVGYEVNFHSTTAFTAGSFTITPPADLRFVDCTAKASSINGYVPNVYLNVTKNKVLFAGFGENASNDIQSFTDLTLVLKFTPNTPIKNSAAGTTWAITIGSISITNTSEATYTCSNASGSAHVHNFSAWSGTGVQTRTCSICSAVDKKVESGNSLGSNTLVSAGNNKATLNFTADGDTVLCALVPTSSITALGSGTVYFVYKYKDDDTPDYKTATAVSSGTEGAYTVFPCGRNGGIGRMSRNITGNFVFVPTSGPTTISAEWSYSIKSYLNSLIDDGTDAQKNYAKALWNYGYYTTQYLNQYDQPGSFAADLAAYGGTKSVAEWSLPSSTGIDSSGSGSWKFKKVAVETGYKPKMHITLDTAGSATVEAYSTSGELVYKKTVSIAANEAFVISDIPTKYLTGTIKVSLGSDTRAVTYAFGRYARARVTKAANDANVFKWMMNYAYYLSEAFA